MIVLWELVVIVTAKWAIFQVYHGKYKLVNEMIISAFSRFVPDQQA
jgi:hypothetical protein